MPARQSSHPISTVSLHVRSLAQLFNSFDPSPFWDRDLDRDAAQFIEEEFSDRPRDRAWHLNITTVEAVEPSHEADVQEAVKRYYQRSTESTRHAIREKLRISRISLAIGVSVFAACMVGHELLAGEVDGHLPRALDEGLIVLAWIALWLPIEQLVGDLIPLLRRRSFYSHIAKMHVHLRRAGQGAASNS
jgi:hypothetical protein